MELKHSIVLLDRVTLGPNTIIPTPSFNHSWKEYPYTTLAQVNARIGSANICISNKVPLNEKNLNGLPNLQFIAVAATGTDHVDQKYCHQHNIRVSNIQDYSHKSVPEHVFAMIGALRRHLIGYKSQIRKGEWQKANSFCLFSYPIKDLASSRMGIIGAGSLGSEVGRIAEAFGMEVCYSRRKGESSKEHFIKNGKKYIPFQELLQNSDVISLHVPLNEQTKNLISLRELATMKKNALLINTARGGVVNERDLVEAIKKGYVGGAGFDVVSREPPGLDHPFYEILDYENFILTPHTAWTSQQAIDALCEQLIENIESFVVGNPRNIIV